MSNKKNNIKDKIKSLKKELPFQVKGEILLFLNEYDEIDAYNMQKDKYWCQAMSATSSNSDLIDGMDFLKRIKNGGITDYDGYISKVYIDKFISNLGLATPYFQSGGFMVSEKQWEELCGYLEVVVDWVNK